jgi:hypothetical protein
MVVKVGKWLCVLLLSLSAQSREPVNSSPPDPKAVVQIGHARFTILTSQLIRMEWSSDPRIGFRDQPTVVITNRNLKAVPNFTVTNDTSKDPTWITITTSNVKIQYKIHSQVSFCDDNLRVDIFFISSKNETVTWTPSKTDKDTNRMFGTVRTLDGVNGSVNLDCFTAGPDSNADSHCAYGSVYMYMFDW